MVTSLWLIKNILFGMWYFDIMTKAKRWLERKCVRKKMWWPNMSMLFMFVEAEIFGEFLFTLWIFFRSLILKLVKLSKYQHFNDVVCYNLYKFLVSILLLQKSLKGKYFLCLSMRMLNFGCNDWKINKSELHELRLNGVWEIT